MQVECEAGPTAGVLEAAKAAAALVAVAKAAVAKAAAPAAARVVRAVVMARPRMYSSCTS